MDNTKTDIYIKNNKTDKIVAIIPLNAILHYSGNSLKSYGFEMPLDDILVDNPTTRITSYNVCYTKLLREQADSAPGKAPRAAGAACQERSLEPSDPALARKVCPLSRKMNPGF